MTGSDPTHWRSKLRCPAGLCKACCEMDRCNARCFGCLPDAPLAVGNATLDEILGDSRDTAETFDQRWIVDSIRDQGAAPTCVGFGVSQAIQVVGRRQQVARGVAPTFPIPSALQLYIAAKCQQESLGVDTGTSIQACLEQAQEIGFLPESKCPYDPFRRFEELDLDESQDALIRVKLRFHRVEFLGRATAKAALSKGCGIAQGLSVDESFQNWTGGVWPGMSGPRLGGHCMDLHDYPDGLPRYVGSYGPEWADGGFLTTTWDVVEQYPAWIIDVVPEA